MTDRHARQAPLAGRYPLVVVVALLALAPYIVLSTASSLTEQVIAQGAHLSTLDGQLADGLANAGYAFGAVFASWLVQRFQQRFLFLLTETAFVVGSLLAATATNAPAFVTGRIIEGATTGLMLVIALPPLITRFPSHRLPTTVVFVNLGLFGAVAAGPVIGGVAATPDGWRVLFFAAAGVGVIGLVIAWLTLERFAPFNPDRPADVPAFGLAVAATFLPFFGVAHLVTNGFADPIVWVPVAAGVLALVMLLVLQELRHDPLMPVRPMAKSLPICGLLTAMLAGAVTVALFELVTTVLLESRHDTPVSTGSLFWPAIAGVVIAAALFGLVLKSRWIPLYVLGGLVLLTASVVLLWQDQSRPAVLAGSGLLGLAAGATVAPGLFCSAFTVDSKLVGRVFSLVELLRAEAAYLVGPVLLHLMLTAGGKPGSNGALTHGYERSLVITFIVTVAGIGLIVALGALGTVPFARPRLKEWLAGDELALEG